MTLQDSNCKPPAHPKRTYVYTHTSLPVPSRTSAHLKRRKEESTLAVMEAKHKAAGNNVSTGWTMQVSWQKTKSLILYGRGKGEDGNS